MATGCSAQGVDWGKSARFRTRRTVQNRDANSVVSEVDELIVGQ